MSLSASYPTIKPSLNLDFANTKVLDPRITFTRASTATFYDGLTTEKAEENLVAYSQEFDNAYWTKAATTVTANSTTAPDGTTTADSMLETATTASHGVGRTSSTQIPTVSGVAYTASFYVKANGRNYCLIYTNAGTLGKYFDITAGGGGSVLGNYGSGPTSASISYVGNNWYRCSITFNSTGISTSAEVYASDTGSNISYAGDITKGLYIWGAQVEQRSTVTAYTATTTQPITNYIPVLRSAAAGVARFDHNPTTGESLGLLIEEQRTNLLTYSDDFANAAWTKSGSTIGTNTLVSPDGTVSADKLIEDTTTGEHKVTQLASLVSGTTYTFSFYAKMGERTGVSFYGADGLASVVGTVNLSTGQVISGTVTVVSVGNGWYRISASGASAFTGNNSITIRVYNTSASYTGDGYSGIYIWGAQLEAGAFATSYIPTVAATVTRAADSARMTGTNFSSWYRVDEGSWFSDVNNVNQNMDRRPFTVRQDASIFYGHRLGTTNLSGLTYRTPTNYDITGAAISVGNVKQSSAYKVNDSVLSTNGVLSGTTAPNALINNPTLYMGNDGIGFAYLNGHIRKIAYYPARLTNAQLQTLTT